MSVTIANGRLILTGHADLVAGSLRFDGDRIAAAGDAIDAPNDALDAKGAVIAPGIIDLGVFAVDKPAFHRGGITRAALMPDQSPPLDYPARVRFAASSGKPDFWVHPLAAATTGLAGSEMAEIALMHDAGAKAVATGRHWIADSGVMYRLMHYCAALGIPLIVHAEDSGLTGKAVATDGEMATRLGLSSAPAEAEAMAIARDIALVRMTGANIHIRQVTTRAGLDLVRGAKAEGLPVTCGITPAHLFLSDLAMGNFRTFARLSPPLRAQDDRLACLAAVADGTIDVISSGHDPRGPEDKRLPFADAAPGMAGAETLLALSLGLVRDGQLSLTKLFDLLARNPARILGVDAGELAAGKDADVILLDPEAPWQISSDKMLASGGNTPFDGQPVQGKVTAVFKGGRRVTGGRHRPA